MFLDPSSPIHRIEDATGRSSTFNRSILTRMHRALTRVLPTSLCFFCMLVWTFADVAHHSYCPHRHTHASAASCDPHSNEDASACGHAHCRGKTHPSRESEDTQPHSCPVCDVISQLSGLIVASVSASSVSQADRISTWWVLPLPRVRLISIASRGPPGL